MLCNGGLLIYLSYMVYGHNWGFFAFELNLKEDKPGWLKAEPVERVYVSYEPKKNLRTYEATLPNQRDREVKALSRSVCVTNEANKNLTPPQKELLRWRFRLVHIGLKHVQWLIRTWRLKVKRYSKTVANCEGPKCASCEFGKGHRRPNKVNKIKKNTMKNQELKDDNLMLR